MVGPQPLPGPARHPAPHRLGHRRDQAHAPGCHPGPIGCPGDHPHQLSRPVATGGGGSSHVPHHDHHAVGTGCADRARLLLLRRFLCVRHLQGRHRPLLGTLPGAGVPEPGSVDAARRGHAAAGAGRHRGRLGLQLRPGRPHRQARPGPTAQPPGLVPEVRASDRPGRRGGRHGGRDGAPVPGRGRSGEAARLRHTAGAPVQRHPQRQPGGGRLRSGAGRGGVHDPQPRLYRVPGRHRDHPGGRDPGGHTRAAARPGPGAGGP